MNRIQFFSKCCFVLILFSSALLLGCQKTPEKLPVPEEKLIPILVDVHLAEAAFQPLTMKLKDSFATKYYRQIFEIHEVKSADFDSSIAILKRDPDWLKAVYTQVLEGIDKAKANKTKE